jgi:hypothetical protein
VRGGTEAVPGRLQGVVEEVEVEEEEEGRKEADEDEEGLEDRFSVHPVETTSLTPLAPVSTSTDLSPTAAASSDTADNCSS